MCLTHKVLFLLTNLLFYLSPQIETPVVEWGYPPGVPTPDPALLVGEPGKSALVLLYLMNSCVQYEVFEI